MSIEASLSRPCPFSIFLDSSRIDWYITVASSSVCFLFLSGTYAFLSLKKARPTGESYEVVPSDKDPLEVGIFINISDSSSSSVTKPASCTDVIVV